MRVLPAIATSVSAIARTTAIVPGCPATTRAERRAAAAMRPIGMTPPSMKYPPSAMAVTISTRCGLFDRMRRPAIVVMKPPETLIQAAQSSIAIAIASRPARSRARVVSRRGIECRYCPPDNSQIKAATKMCVASGLRHAQGRPEHRRGAASTGRLLLWLGSSFLRKRGFRLQPEGCGCRPGQTGVRPGSDPNPSELMRPPHRQAGAQD